MDAGRDSLLSAMICVSCGVLALRLGWCCGPAAKLTQAQFQSCLVGERPYSNLLMVCVG